MKKWISRALRLTAALALVLSAVWLAAGLKPAAPPQPEAQPASRTLITEGELLYDGTALTASDVSFTGDASAIPPADPAPEETPPEDTSAADTPTEDVPADTADGLEDFQNIADKGGGSGGQLPSRDTGGQTDGGSGQPEEGDAWFTTSIVDGDRVTDADYPFTIRHLKPDAQVLGLSVTVNGAVTDYAANTAAGTLTLTGGANTVTVTAQYQTADRTVTAVRTYTLYYLDGQWVLIVQRASDDASLSGLTVTERTLTFRAVAVQADVQQPVQTVRVNGSTVTGSGDLYTTQLRAGDNEITVEAGGRIGLTETYTVTYTAPSFRIDTLFSDGQTRTVTADTPSGGSETVTVEGSSEDICAWVSVEGVTGLETLEELRLDGRRLAPGADGGYAVTLNARTPVTLTLYYTDSDGASREYSYILRFQRTGGAEEAQPPTISVQIEADGTTMGLTDGLVLKNPAVLLLVEGRSGRGEQLYSNNFTVTVNGTVIPAPASQSGSLFGYDAYLLYEGANTITVTAVDNDGVSASRTWTVYYEAGQITVTVSVEATTVGLGTLVPYASVTVPGGTDALTILEQALAQYGYTADVERGEYLSAICGPGICTGYSIDPELMELIVADGMDAQGVGYDPAPASEDRLGEFDFYRWSGWMFSVNGSYPGIGMASYAPQDGAVLRVRFTLAMGKDIGAYDGSGGAYGESSGNYYREW